MPVITAVSANPDAFTGGCLARRNVDPDHVKARMEDGVLTVTILQGGKDQTQADCGSITRTMKGGIDHVRHQRNESP